MKNGFSEEIANESFENINFNVSTLGQVFTPQDIVKRMLGLIKNKGRVLEPSCGDGAFSMHLSNCVAIEIDKSKSPQYAINMDFFDYPISEKFDTIIGNPPYVRYKDILKSTKSKLNMHLFDERSNLYLFFIYKSIQHLNPKGELIFIVPREFLKSTSAIQLNEYIYQQGTITDIIDLGDRIIFSKYSPNCVIFRFEKDNYSRITNVSKKFGVINGQILFTENEYSINFSDLFYVKVGGVSGYDKCFINEHGNLDFVCSTTRQTGKTRKMFYNVYSPELLQYKELLCNRKIKNFNQDNWFMWGRNFYMSDSERLYVNCKTRQTNPFFYNSCKNYDGSVLGIFPKFNCSSDVLKNIAKELNEVNWYELGFVCDGRFLFSQKSLENTVLPDIFSKYLKYLE